MTDPAERRRDTETRSTSPPGTIDVIYDRLSGVAEAQLGDQANLDGKMVQIFTAASVVIGLTGLTATSTSKNPDLVVTFLGLALACYALVAVAAGLALWAAKFDTLRFGSTLWEDEWDQPPEQVKLAVIDAVKTAYDSNVKILNDKARLLSCAIATTGLEVGFVAAAIIVRVAS